MSYGDSAQDNIKHMSQGHLSQADGRFSEGGPGTVRRSYLYSLTTLAAVGGFLFGYDLSIIAGATPFLEGEFSPSPWLLGFGASSAIIGCILGALSLGGLTDRWGRKKALYLCATLLGISALGTAFPRGMLDFSIFRIVGGMGVGLVSIVSPMYIAEVAPPRLRGRLVWGHQLAIVIGSLAALCVSYLFSSASWRGVFASELAPILLLLIGLRWIPESPRWLAQRNREREAHTVFASIGGLQHADLEMGRISCLPMRQTGSFADLFQPGIRMAVLIACGLAVLQQTTGAGPLLLSAPVAFRRAGFQTIASDPMLQSIVVTSWKLLWTVAGLWAIDRFGRRALFLTGVSAMVLGLAPASVFLPSDSWPPALLLAMLLVVAGVVISLAPLAWLIMSEIFPTHLRARGMTLASLSLWVSAFLGSSLFPAMMASFQEHLGSEAWGLWIFLAVCLFALVSGWRLLPETKGRSLEEIGQSWQAQARNLPPERPG